MGFAYSTCHKIRLNKQLTNGALVLKYSHLKPCTNSVYVTSGCGLCTKNVCVPCVCKCWMEPELESWLQNLGPYHLSLLPQCRLLCTQSSNKAWIQYMNVKLCMKVIPSLCQKVWDSYNIWWTLGIVIYNGLASGQQECCLGYQDFTTCFRV